MYRGCHFWNTGSWCECAFEGSKEKEKSTQSYQEEMVSLGNKKLEWLIKHEENDDLNFHRSQVTYMKQIPPTKKKLFLRSQFQTLVADEISALQNNLLHLQLQVWTVSMAVGLENRTRTSVMSRIISHINLLELFLRVYYCRDHRYLVFINPFVTGGTYVSLKKSLFKSAGITVSHFFSMLPSTLYLYFVEPVRMQFPAKQPCTYDTLCSAANFLRDAIYLEVSLFRWTSQNAFFRETAVYKWDCVQCCIAALHTVGYCYPSGLAKTLCKWDIPVYDLLAAKGLIHITDTVNHVIVTIYLH
jgi:hypothetical protein